MSESCKIEDWDQLGEKNWVRITVTGLPALKQTHQPVHFLPICPQKDHSAL